MKDMTGSFRSTLFGLGFALLLAPLSACLMEEDPELPPTPPGGSPDEVCGEIPLETGAKVLLVLDKSGTMFADELSWDHDADPNTPEIHRWESLHAVVQFLVDQFDDEFSLGALMFPSIDSGCQVNHSPEIPIAANNGTALMNELPAADAYYDAYHLTPLPTALEYALDYMRSFDEEDTRAIILVSDGVPSPTCEGGLSEATNTAREAWNEYGIPVYVVGVAIEEEYAQEYGLLAAAGGRPAPDTSFYDTQDELQLQDAIEEITNDIPDCRVKLETEPTYPDQLSIEVAGETVPALSSCGSEAGWIYADEDHRVIEFCGVSCDALEAGENDVVAIYGCENEGQG